MDRHLQECADCRAQSQVWEKFEHKMSQYYQSRRLGEDFVQKVHQRVAFLNMEQVEPNRPGISGRVYVPAIRWLQPVGLAAGLLLAVMLFTLRHDPSLGRWLAGQGFLMTRPAESAMELGRNSHRIVRPGDIVWTNASQQLKIQLPGDLPVNLSERGLISLDAAGSSRESTARLYSGRVQVDAPGSQRSFTLNTAAGRVRGQAGRIGVSADWIALPEREWKNGAASGAWTEGWQAIPMAKVDVAEGSAEVASAEGSETALVAGQYALMSAAFAAPIVSKSPESTEGIIVSRIAESDTGPRITSELLSGGDEARIAINFVNIPLQTVLSSVAEVQPSQMQLDPAVKATPVSLRVVRPLAASTESVLSAVAGYSGLSYEKTDRAMTTDMVDVSPSLSRENEAGGGASRLTLEMAGSEVKLLRGSGVRMSVLAKAIESAVDSPVETGSADWALSDFELRDVPRSQIRETLARKLGLQFQKVTRSVPLYRIHPGSGDRRQSHRLNPIFGSRDGYGQAVVSDDFTSTGGAIGSGAAAQNSPPVAVDFGNQGAGAASGPDDGSKSSHRGFSSNPAHVVAGALADSGSAKTIFGALSSWLGSLPVSWNGGATPGGGLTQASSSGSQSSASSAGSGQVTSAQSTATGTSTSGTQPLGIELALEQAQRAMDLLERHASELDAGQHLVFPPFAIEGLTQDPEIQPLGLLFFSLFNETDFTTQVKVRCRTASGGILGSTVLTISQRSFLMAGGLDLFPALSDERQAAYVEAESESPISGMQMVLLGTGLEVFPGAPASQSRRLWFSWPARDGRPAPQAVFGLTNDSELFHEVQVSLMSAEGITSGQVNLSLAPYQSMVLELNPPDNAEVTQNPAAQGWMIRVETSQSGLAGFLAIGGLGDPDFQIVPAGGKIAQEWQFTVNNDLVSMGFQLTNPNDSPAQVQFLPGGCPDSMNERAPKTVALPAWGSRSIQLSSEGAGQCGTLRLLSTQPVQAAILTPLP